MKTFKGLLKELPENGIFVFFSSMTGYHDKGTSKIAFEKFGAIWGKAFCSMGNSYAICIKDLTSDKIEQSFMKTQIETFYRVCERDKDKLFYVMCSTNTIANYTARDLVNVFKSKGKIPENIVFEEDFYKLFTNKTQEELEMEV